MSTNFARRASTRETWFQNAISIERVLHKQVEAQCFAAEPDAVLSIENHCFDVTLRSSTCMMLFDVGKQLWLNKARWSRLIREYINAERLEEFILNSQQIYIGGARDGAVANMLFRDPPKKAKKHRWGGCLLAATFRKSHDGGLDTKGILSFYSRTTYMGYMAFLDGAIAAVLARAIGDPQCISFQWTIGSSQLHHFKSLPYLYTRSELFKRIRAKRSTTIPGLKHLNSWQDRVERDIEKYGIEALEYERYGPFKRVKRRWMEHTGMLQTDPPSMMVADLDFSKASTDDEVSCDADGAYEL